MPLVAAVRARYAGLEHLAQRQDDDESHPPATRAKARARRPAKQRHRTRRDDGPRRAYRLCVLDERGTPSSKHGLAHLQSDATLVWDTKRAPETHEHTRARTALNRRARFMHGRRMSSSIRAAAALAWQVLAAGGRRARDAAARLPRGGHRLHARSGARAALLGALLRAPALLLHARCLGRARGAVGGGRARRSGGGEWWRRWQECRCCRDRRNVRRPGRRDLADTFLPHSI